MARRWVKFRAGGFVALWSVSGAERVARSGSGEASVWGDSGGSSGVFRDSTIDALEQAAPRASRFRGAGACWRSHDGISRAEARTMTRKLTGVRWSHLMHQMNQGFILSDSQKGIALMRRRLRARKYRENEFFWHEFARKGQKKCTAPFGCGTFYMSKNLKKDWVNHSRLAHRRIGYPPGAGKTTAEQKTRRRADPPLDTVRWCMLSRLMFQPVDSPLSDCGA